MQKMEELVVAAAAAAATTTPGAGEGKERLCPGGPRQMNELSSAHYSKKTGRTGKFSTSSRATR